MNRALTALLSDIATFSAHTMGGRALRGYQSDAASPLLDSILAGGEEQFAVVFSRQAGKDEMLAQLLALTLLRRAYRGGTVVVAAPTLRPQALISRDRLLERLRGNPLTAPLTRIEGPSTVRVGKAKAVFLSAARTANARGQTADLALIANEAQDIDPAVWDAVFDPMAASTNATTIFLGTVWSKDTLLARQMRHIRRKEAEDGRQRLFLVPWQRVSEDVPAYGDRVRARIEQLGERHPFIRTEYFLEELDGENSLFPPHRIAQMQGDHPRQHRATPGKRYALLLDVAGEEESGNDQLAFGMDGPGRRDSTALTVIEVDTTSRADGRPEYRVVDRLVWTGVRHATLHGHLVDLARSVWKASWVVVDATGIGAGLASFLDASLGRHGIRVIPFIFSAVSKSRLGWDFVGLIESGRYKEYANDDDELTDLFHAQARATTYEIRNGPGNLLRWSVPESAGHDDLVMSAALVAALDSIDLRRRIAVGS
ncbi:MAG TPA: hypothetical protein VNZ58_08470 [Thermomicrobiales bacterium]|nr:hypothetical protein [Thermomicrobiales bacterium]